MKKAAQDKTRSQSYTKILRDISAAVQRSGAEPDSNFALKVALAKSRKFNVPRDNVEKAIKRGLGGTEADWADVNYEGYGPEGVAIFVEAVTNNPTRTIANIRLGFRCGDGSLGKEGCLQFVFERKSVFTLKDEDIDIDQLTMDLIDAGAEDVGSEDGFITITAPVDSYGDVHKKLDEMKIPIEDSALERVPLVMKEVADKSNYARILKIVAKLEDDEDVQHVYHNMEFNEKFSEE